MLLQIVIDVIRVVLRPSHAGTSTLGSRKRYPFQIQFKKQLLRDDDSTKEEQTKNIELRKQKTWMRSEESVYGAASPY
jgi:hypothetical protein